MSTHHCFTRIDVELAKENTRLVFLDDTQGDRHLVIASERIRNLRDGKKATPVFGAFCPFCGERLTHDPTWPGDFNTVPLRTK